MGLKVFLCADSFRLELNRLDNEEERSLQLSCLSPGGLLSLGTAGYEAGLAKPFDSSSAGGNVGRSTEVISCSSHNSARELTTRHTLALPEEEPVTPCSEGAQGREKRGQGRSCKTKCKPGGGADRKRREKRWGNVRKG